MEYKEQVVIVLFSFIVGLVRPALTMKSFVVTVFLGLLAHQAFADEPEAIVGGTPAGPNEFPYQCSINMYNNHICGCSILNEVQVLTAAHCVYNLIQPPFSSARIITGSLDSHNGYTYAIRDVVIHPEYSPDVRMSWKNDIAIITLKKSMVFNNKQSPVQLPTGPPSPNSKCVLSGWGKTSTNGQVSPRLLKMNTAVVKREICERVMRISLFETHVCAFTQKGIGACQGDSGGPLVCDGQQVGVTSFVLPCAQGVPDVYTNVFHHLNFIRQAWQYS